MPYLSDFTNVEAYSNQADVVRSTSIIAETREYSSVYSSSGHTDLTTTLIVAAYTEPGTNKGFVRAGVRENDYCINWGTAVEFSGTATEIVIVKVSSTKFLIAYSGADSDGFCIAGTVSGSTITLGTAVEFADAITCYILGAAFLDTDKVIIAYQNGTTDQRAIVVTLVGTAITAGTSVVVNNTGTIETNYVNKTQIARLSNTLAIMVYRYNTASYCVTLSVSGTTITVNTAGASATLGIIYNPTIAAISATNSMVAYNDASDSARLYVHPITISSTTVTLGTKVNKVADSSLTRIPTIISISNNGGSYALSYLPASGGLAGAFILNTTGVTYSNFNISSNSTPTYGNIMNVVHKVNMTETKNGQITFSYNSDGLGLFLCHTLNSFSITPTDKVTMMQYKIAEAGNNEQVEISSIYLSMTFSSTNQLTVELYIDGNPIGNIYTTPYVIPNSPIILKSNQKLYMSYRENTSYQRVKVAVFGVKRS
jgi:hypothetical protein